MQELTYFKVGQESIPNEQFIVSKKCGGNANDLSEEFSLFFPLLLLHFKNR
jgi:hypothetical protein